MIPHLKLKFPPDGGRTRARDHDHARPDRRERGHRAAAFAAADAHRADGESRAAAAARDTGHRRAAHCEGASTPGLVNVDVVVPMTSREREIAVLARAGLTSKEIAARLFLSPRTIDNHLQRIYAKLGVTNRSGLADVLDPEGQRS
jgi:DNA-binding CsgD family transcriptional regulator